MSIPFVSVTRYPERVVRTVLATILAAYGSFAAQADNRTGRVDKFYKKWPLIATADHADACAHTLSPGQQAQQDGGLAATFSLLNWNVEKAKDPGLVSEFDRNGTLYTAEGAAKHLELKYARGERYA